MVGTLGIGRLAWPIGFAVCITVFLAMLLKDSGDCRSCARIIFLGTAPSPQDRPYQKYLAALSQRNSNRLPKYLIQHVHGNDGPANAIAKWSVQQRLKPGDIVVALSASDALAVRQSIGSTSSAMIFASYPNPAQLGLVEDLRLPRNRTTGVWLDVEMHVKRLEILRDAFAGVKVVGVLVNRHWLHTHDLQATLTQPAQKLGLEIRLLVADDESEVAAGMSAHSTPAVNAWYIPPSQISDLASGVIIRQLNRLGLPAIHSSEAEVANGALMAYSQDTSFVFNALADLTVRVLQGEEPGRIAIQRPMRFVLSVRPREGHPGLQVSPQVIRRADRIY